MTDRDYISNEMKSLFDLANDPNTILYPDSFFKYISGMELRIERFQKECNMSPKPAMGVRDWNNHIEQTAEKYNNARISGTVPPEPVQDDFDYEKDDRDYAMAEANENGEIKESLY